MARIVHSSLFSHREPHFLQKQSRNDRRLFFSGRMANNHHIAALSCSPRQRLSTIYDDIQVSLQIYRIQFFEMFSIKYIEEEVNWKEVLYMTFFVCLACIVFTSGIKM